MVDWFVNTLRSYPEIAIFLSLALGYYFGSFTYKGLGLGAVTATLIAAVIIGQLGITISPPLKATFFLMFLFAIGYGVGPQFVRGIAKDGVPQALFAVVVCVFCLLAAYIGALIAGYDVGSAAGLYAGSQTISASMGLATDAINRLGLPPEEAKRLLDAMPVAYAVTYIFGTVGSAIVLALLGPALLGIDLEAECKRYEAEHGGKKEVGGAGTAWHRYELRAFQIREDGIVIGKTAQEAEALVPDRRVFIERVRRGGQIMDATADTVIQAGDVVAIAGPREVLVELIGPRAAEVDDRELLAVPVEGVDILVTSKKADGKTLEELAKWPAVARRLPAQDHPRSDSDRHSDPSLDPDQPRRHPHPRRTHTRHQRRHEGARLSPTGRPTSPMSPSSVRAIAIGALIGALVYNVGDIPLTLSTSGGALISGLFFGWLRSVHPTFGRIPSPAVWFMNSVGLNVFIAVVGISSGPGFVAGLQQLGFSLFLWGIAVTTVPLILAMYVGKYVFRFHPAILLGCCSGARTTTASLGMINDRAKSQIPGLGYTVTYAVGNTLLTIWGMVLVILMT